MPTMADLGKLATELYKGNPTVGAYQQINSGLELDTSKASSLGFGNSRFWVWSGEEYTSTSAFFRSFSQSITNYGNLLSRGHSGGQAFCVSE